MSLWRKRQIMERQSVDSKESSDDAEQSDVCESCGGWGYHGIEEESGLPYVCYSCCGTGK